MIGVTVLGSTGSIGVNTLDVVRRHGDRFRVEALTANRDVEKLVEQCQEFQPGYAVLADQTRVGELQSRLHQVSPDTEVMSGVEGLEAVAQLAQVSYVMAAIVGAAGLRPALAAVRAGKRVLLANKEALVVAGPLFMQEAAVHGAEILPIDSEHNAVFQCLPADFGRGLDSIGVRQILLTASGGPFRQLPLEAMATVTPEQACAHPNWNMGRKISVDSATMMNKGLEVIEACWLFGASPEQVRVVLHPQSVIHSLVEYADGSVLAQMGNPDMRTPIAHAMGWPERIESGVASLDLLDVARLDFEPPNLQRFPCLRLAYQAVKQGGSCPAILNAANEVAVNAFLQGQVKFTAIPELIENTLAEVPACNNADLEELMNVDATARSVTEQAIVGRV
jgi:1-deoxy-D-xylulose-5-phosphate reductoisomerase